MVKVAALKIHGSACKTTEARTFLKLGRHARFVRFLGKCVEGDSEVLVTELAPYGSLKQAVEVFEGKNNMKHFYGHADSGALPLRGFVSLLPL